MKEICDNKVPLVKMSQDDPFYPSSKKITSWTATITTLGSPNDQGEGYQQPITYTRVSQSGQVEIKIEYQDTIPTTLYLTELDNVVP